MCDHTRKSSHISLSQEKIFSFYSKLGHFYSHVVPKNKDFSGKCSFDYLDIKVLKNWQTPINDSTWDQMPSTSHFWLYHWKNYPKLMLSNQSNTKKSF